MKSPGAILLALGGATALLALAAGYLLSASSSVTPVAPIALAGGAIVTMVVFISPRFGFYALLFSAMFGRFEIPVGGISVRPDQLVLVPVLVGVILRLGLASSSLFRFNSHSRPYVVPVTVFLGLAMYIAVNTLSSALFSPQLGESLAIIVWLLLSFLAFAAAYLLIGRYVSVREALFAVLAAGFLSGGVGILLFLLSQVTGFTFGVQQDIDLKIYGTFFEANIFGSFQAFSAIAGIAVLQLAQLPRRAFWWVTGGTILSVVALTLSFTRAAWLAFLAGLLVLLLSQLQSRGFFSLILRLGTLGVLALLVLAPAGLLGSLGERFLSISDGADGTLEYRITRYEIALSEWPASPILGLGTNSFGQRHLDPTQSFASDYLPGLLIATLYDTGLLGLLILLAVFGAILWALLRSAARSGGEERAFALALLCGVVSFLVSYQSTNAFWFSYNWIILAVALRLYQTVRLRRLNTVAARRTGETKPPGRRVSLGGGSRR